MVIFGEPQWGKITDLPGIQDLSFFFFFLRFIQNILIGVGNTIFINIYNSNQLTCK